jgi:hypothetical protein
VAARLPSHTAIYQGATFESINDEQESLYTAAVLAGVYKGVREKFLKILNSYDFSEWRGVKGGTDWSDFVADVVGYGSINVKMLVSACRFKTIKLWH